MKEEKKKRPIKVSSRKAKARRLQDWVAAQISDLLNIPWGHDDNSLIESRIMGQSGVDIILRGRAFELFKYAIECKYTERWDVPGAMEQAIKNTKEGTNWLLFFKRNRTKPIVILDAQLFFDLMKEFLDDERRMEITNQTCSE